MTRARGPALLPAKQGPTSYGAGYRAGRAGKTLPVAVTDEYSRGHAAGWKAGGHTLPARRPRR